MKKWMMTAALAGTLTLPVWSAGDLEDLRGLVLTHAKVPLYNKQNLQMMVFSNKAERQGRLMVGHDAVMDIIRSGADVDSIRDGWDLKPYGLGASLTDVLNFWGGRLYSEGVIITSRADVDQEARMAAGSEPVFFRSPLLDLNGIGFEADFNKRTVLVKEDVQIVLRMQSSDPRVLLAAKSDAPVKYEFVKATSDSLLIDMTNNQILLIGNVVVDEEHSVINCDRMTIYLNRKSDEELQQANREDKLSGAGELGGVSRVLCDGNVVISRKLTAEEKAEGEQTALADHLVYDLPTGAVTLTGERNFPVVKRGRESLSGRNMVLYREQQRAVINGDSRIVVIQPPKNPGEPETTLTINSDQVQLDYLKNYGDFIGNVTVEEARMQLKCAQMQVELKDIAGVSAAVPQEAQQSLAGIPEFSAGAKRELDKIRCLGGVNVTRKDAAGKLLKDERAVSREALFDYASRTITMSGNSPTLTRGAESMSGQELVIWINEERLSARNDSRIVLGENRTIPAAGAAAAALPAGTVITSDSSDLDYGGDKLTFTGHVRVRDPRLELDCDKMEILLTPNAASGKKAERSEALEFGSVESGDKTLSRVICTGNVHAVDAQVDLKTDKMVLNFRPSPAGAPAVPGVFQSNGTELVSIDCDGKVVMVNKPDAEGEKRRVAKSEDTGMSGMLNSSSGPRIISADRGRVDFLKHISEFHENVHVRDDENSLKCNEMYLYAAKAAAPGTKPVKAAVNPDADPFATEEVSQVPARIALTDGLDLSRVLCRGDVFFSRRDKDGKMQQAGGNEADYVVADRKMVVTGEPDKQPWMRAEGGRMRGDKIIVHVDEERMETIGNTRFEADNGEKFQ